MFGPAASRVEMENGIAHARLVRSDEASADMVQAELEALASSYERLAPRSEVGSALIDLLGAPPALSPGATAAIGRVFRAFERAQKPVVVVVGMSATQRLQIDRLAAEHAPRRGAVLSSREDALEFISFAS